MCRVYTYLVSSPATDPTGNSTRSRTTPRKPAAGSRSLRDISTLGTPQAWIGVDRDKKWLYAAIDTESKLLLEVDVFSGCGTDPVTAFLYSLIEETPSSTPSFWSMLAPI